MNYFRFKAVAVLLYTIKDGKSFVLLGKRTVFPCKNKYSFVTGTYEKYDKSLRHTAVREVKEELDLNININKLVLIKKFRIFCKVDVFAYKLDSKLELKFNEEFESLKWFEFTSLPFSRCYFVKRFLKKIK